MVVSEIQVAGAPLTAAELYQELLQEKRRFILDVRNATEFDRRQIEGRASLNVVNIPYDNFLKDEAAAVAQVPADGEILVVCAQGISSQYVAEILQKHGRTTISLAGGMQSWSEFYDTRDIINEPFGRITQIARPVRGDLSFVVISAGQSVIIDPLRHLEQYTRFVSATGATVTAVFDTHIHADHISGGPALARQTGAPYYVHPYDAIHPIDMLPATISYEPLRDGQQFQVGQFTVKVIWFPGHTLGQVNYLFTGPDGQTYLFTGDGIFLNSFGRPDLGGQAAAWTPLLYQSLYERLPQHINDDTLILPAHFSSVAEGDRAGRFAASYGQVRRQNEALAPRTLTDFTAYVVGNLPVFPPEYVEIKRVNIGLVQPDEEEAGELEMGKNICALAG